MNTPVILQHQAHLWIASNQTLQQQIIKHLQEILCLNNLCTVCTVCKLIEQKQHPATCWIQPDGSYHLDQMDEILETVRFKLNAQEQRFIIFEQAEQLSANCNNRLLKTVEEPHEGYFFIFLATRTDNILPTLQSRCFVKEFHHQTDDFAFEAFVQPFLNNRFDKPAEFIKSIDTFEIKERETKDIIDFMITHFYMQLQRLHSQNTSDFEKMLELTHKITVLKYALLKLPPQGSAKMFWKNLYLQFDGNR